MSEDENESFSEAFIRLNANLPFISSRFAQVLRDLMRGASSHDPSSNLHAAAKNMNFVADLLSRTEKNISFHALFSEALKELAIEVEWGSVDYAVVDAARRGVKYLVELSCSDGAARGRASRRRSEFMAAIKGIEDARDYNRRKSDR